MRPLPAPPLTTTPAAVVRDDLLAEVSRTADPATGWSSSLPFTATAKQALELTLRESLGTGGSISPEHLLVGIALAAAEPTAAVLTRLGLTPDLLRGHLGLDGRSPAGGPGEGDRPVAEPTISAGPWVGQLPSRAHGWAVALGADEVRAEHVLLALLQDQVDHPAVIALRDSGADLKELRDRLLDLGSE